MFYTFLQVLIDTTISATSTYIEIYKNTIVRILFPINTNKHTFLLISFKVYILGVKINNPNFSAKFKVFFF